MPTNDAELITVEVACATPERQKILVLQVAQNSTAREVVLASGIDKYFDGIDWERCPLGIFGRVVGDDQRLRAGDRLEIYRPLVNEPRDARRAAAARGDTLGSAHRHSKN